MSETPVLRPRSTPLVRLRESVRHPVEALYRVRGRIEIATEPKAPAYVPTHDWEARLHDELRSGWPCPSVDAFHFIWRQLRENLVEFGAGHDADDAFARAVWCTVRHAIPRRVVEVGVARGVSSRMVLEAMERNGSGHLWSVDLPPILEGWRTQVATAVPAGLRGRWTYVRGPGRRRLPHLLSGLGGVDMFVHDGLHTTPTLERELGLAWRHLEAGGILIVNGIERSEAIQRLLEHWRPPRSLIGEYETKRGIGRSKGLFAVMWKPVP